MIGLLKIFFFKLKIIILTYIQVRHLPVRDSVASGVKNERYKV